MTRCATPVYSYDPTTRMEDSTLRADPAVALAGWEAALRAAESLQSSGMVSKVWIWGSLLIAGEFHSRSDIDIHVSWRAGADRYALWERCVDVAHPFPIEFSKVGAGKSPIPHPIVRYRSLQQSYEPQVMTVNRRLRLLQDRMDNRRKKLIRTSESLAGECAALRGNGREDLERALKGFAWQVLREVVHHGSLKMLWLLDRRPIWEMSVEETLFAATRDVPGLRPALFSPEVASRCVPTEAGEVADIEETIGTAIKDSERFSRFLSGYIDPATLRHR